MWAEAHADNQNSTKPEREGGGLEEYSKKAKMLFISHVFINILDDVNHEKEIMRQETKMFEKVLLYSKSKHWPRLRLSGLSDIAHRFKV